MSTTRPALPLLSLLLLTAPLSVFPAPELRQFPSGQPVSQSQLPEAICRGWVEVRATAAVQVVFWDILLDLGRDSRVFLGCNQDYIYALSLAGSFDNGSHVVTPGMASLWSHFGGSGDGPAIHEFSAPALLRLFAEGGHAEDPDLRSIAAIQGNAGPGLEAAALTPATHEARPFRTFPEIMAIKRASRHQEDYGLRTATQFANALSDRDTGLLGALLAPTLFENETSSAVPSIKPSPARIAFAERLISLNDYDPLTSPSGLVDLGNFQYEMRSTRQAFRITLQQTDGCFFVKRLEPAS